MLTSGGRGWTPLPAASMYRRNGISGIGICFIVHLWLLVLVIACGLGKNALRGRVLQNDDTQAGRCARGQGSETVRKCFRLWMPRNDFCETEVISGTQIAITWVPGLVQYGFGTEINAMGAGVVHVAPHFCAFANADCILQLLFHPVPSRSREKRLW